MVGFDRHHNKSSLAFLVLIFLCSQQGQDVSGTIQMFIVDFGNFVLIQFLEIRFHILLAFWILIVHNVSSLWVFVSVL